MQKLNTNLRICSNLEPNVTSASLFFYFPKNDQIGQKYPAGCRSANPRRIGVPNNILDVLYPLDVFYPSLSCVYFYFSPFLTFDV